MQITAALVTLLAATASAGVAPRQGGGTVNQSVIPKDFGVKAGDGKDKVQVGSCSTPANKLIPCYCPPAPDSPEFLQKLTKALSDGFILSKEQVLLPITLDKFNDASDTSVPTQKLRATAMIQVMQNFNLTTQGVGCPGASVPILGAMQQSGKIGGDTSGASNLG